MRETLFSSGKVDDVRHTEEPEERAPGPGQVRALGVADDHRIGEIADPLPGGQPNRAVVEGVLHPVGVTPVRQGMRKPPWSSARSRFVMLCKLTWTPVSTLERSCSGRSKRANRASLVHSVSCAELPAAAISDAHWVRS